MIGGPLARFFLPSRDASSRFEPFYSLLMKTLLIIITAIVALVCLYLAWISWRAERPALGMEKGKLSTCALHTNCVCSEYPGEAAIAPLSVGGPAQPMEAVAAAVIESGGKIDSQGTDYLRAVFRSRWFRFTDDVEFRLDNESNVVHVRSASRAGTSDLGVNRARVEKLRRLLEQKQ